jgi:hypothetical protein
MGRVCWSESHGYRSNSDCGVENSGGMALQNLCKDLDHQRPMVRGLKDHDHPLRIREQLTL